MTLSEETGALKKFRRTAWKFQQTFLTPMQRLPTYVAGIISANEQMKSGCLTIEQAVFEPTHLINLLTSYSLPPRYEGGLSLTATGQQEVEMLLLAIFISSLSTNPNHLRYTLITMNTQPSLPTRARTSTELLRLLPGAVSR
jgi:hypothetical protein